MHKTHLCLAFEVLNSSLYDTLKRGNHRGLPLDRIRVICSGSHRAICTGPRRTDPSLQRKF
jgi:hypothetical protein